MLLYMLKVKDVMYVSLDTHCSQLTVKPNLSDESYSRKYEKLLHIATYACLNAKEKQLC